MLMFTLTIGGALAASANGGPWWIQALLGVMGAISYYEWWRTHRTLLEKNPDALRSEAFAIRKLEIERGIAGVRPPPSEANPQRIIDVQLEPSGELVHESKEPRK